MQHVWGLLSHPADEWKVIRKEGCPIGGCYILHIMLLAAIPPVCGYFGTTRIGWQIGAREAVKLTHESALTIAILYYVVLLVGVLTVGALIHWMGQTYGSKKPASQSIALAGYTATPLFLVGVMQLYPLLWLNLIVGLPALAYTIFLLFSGVPVMMGISKERGFLFSSAVLAVGLVMLVGLLAASVILWGIGVGPAFVS
jgi:Yip1 domain